MVNPNRVSVRNGFALIELLIVVMILSVLARMTLPFFKLDEQRYVQMEVERLGSACTFLHCCARTTGRKQKMHFDLEHSRYTFGTHTVQLGQDVQFGILPNVCGPPSKPTKLLTKPITCKNQEFICYPDGRTSAGIICIMHSKKPVLYAISSDVGKHPYCRIYRYDIVSSAWVLQDAG